MSHITQGSAYSSLVDRLNRFPQGAPPSELLNRILRLLFSEHEARLVALLPIKPFTAGTAARLWNMPEAEAHRVLDALADRGIVMDTDDHGHSVYSLPPPMAGFFEFSLMRVRQDVDQKLLSELFFQYLNVEDDFIKALFTTGETQLGRVYVNEAALPVGISMHVLDYERATEVIRTARCRAVGACYCRHKMSHMHQACDAPMEICMTFNNAAESLGKHGVARSIDAGEAIDLLQSAYAHNLVQFGENVRQDVNFICNCCGCCCEAMIASRKYAILNPVHTTNFLPSVNEESCTGCGKCAEVCPVEAMTLVSANDPHKPKRKKACLDAEICLGCGVCARVCTPRSISLVSREKRVITPLNGAHKTVMMAIERGKLQNLIFDNQVLWSHRALAALFGAILKMPPVKQVMASKQIKSRYLETLIQKKGY